MPLCPCSVSRTRSYTGTPRERANSHATSREGTARRVHSPSYAMNTIVVAVTLVGGST